MSNFKCPTGIGRASYVLLVEVKANSSIGHANRLSDEGGFDRFVILTYGKRTSCG